VSDTIAAEHEGLSPQEQEQKSEAEQRSAPSADIVYGAILGEGERELDRSPSTLLWSGLAAGLSMGFSLVGVGLLEQALPDEPWRPLIANLGYSLGFIVVILGRQQLFTENTLTAVLPLLTHRGTDTLARMLRLWAIVLVANLIGAAIFAWVVASTNVFPEEVRSTFASVAERGLPVDFLTTLVRGVFAGWLIALIVWMLPFAGDGRLAVIVILTYTVAPAGLAHVIAGSVDVLYLVWRGSYSFFDYVVLFLVPALIGNTIGGVSLVALLNHGQVSIGKDRQ
jgi:formate/nitrite transporter FocA (FNT family)